MRNQPYDWQSRNLEEVSGIFTNQQDLERVLQGLDEMNLRTDTSVLMTDDTRRYYETAWKGGSTEEYRQDRDREQKTEEHGNKVPEGTATGGLTGGILGLIIGGLTMAGSVIVPGAGLLVAGPLVGALTGGAVGAAAGGLIGALVGAGIPEEKARYYESALQERGNVLVVAHVPKNQEDAVRDLFERCGARQVRVT